MTLARSGDRTSLADVQCTQTSAVHVAAYPWKVWRYHVYLSQNLGALYWACGLFSGIIFYNNPVIIKKTQCCTFLSQPKNSGAAVCQDLGCNQSQSSSWLYRMKSFKHFKSYRLHFGGKFIEDCKGSEQGDRSLLLLSTLILNLMESVRMWTLWWF